jgi:OOP family OmpA-OmpF porin
MNPRIIAAVSAVAIAGSVACTKTVALKDDNPVQISAAPPAPEPEPEPEPEPPRVEVQKERIQVNETIEFEYNKAVIREQSFELMAEIAKVINEHPEILKIRLEGHTDNVGGKKFNMNLSLRRARAVRDHLVKKGGVDAGRLEVAGFGFDQPVASNDTEEGRAQNRRVAFEITERAAGGEGDGATASDGGDDAGDDTGDDANDDDGGQ